MLALLFLGLAQATPPPPVHVGPTSRGGVLAYILDREGELLVADWLVSITRVTRDPRRPGLPIYSVPRRTSVDPGTGCAAFDGLPPGNYELSALHPMGEWTSTVDLQVRPRETVDCELLAERGDPRRALVVEVQGVDPSTRPRLVARNVAGSTFELRQERPRGPFVARDVPLERYTVEVDDPRFLESLVHDVVPGRVGHLSLTGSAGLALRFRCAHDGSALAPTELTVGEASAVFRDRVAGGEHELHGLLPGEHVLIAQFPQHATLALPIAELAPRELRAMEAEVPRGASVCGVVVDASGAPCEGVFVEARAYPELAGASELQQRAVGASASLQFHGNVVSKRFDLTGLDLVDRRSGWTDAAGRFELRGFVPGEVDVSVWPTPSSSLYARAIVVEGEARATAPEFRLRGVAHADVSVLLPQGLALADFTLSLQVAGGPPSKLAHRPAALDARGRFVLRGLAPRPTKLIAARRPASPKRDSEPSATWEVEFIPTTGSAAQAVLDLSRVGE